MRVELFLEVYTAMIKTMPSWYLRS